jgi:Putative GTPase activating protein for Arf
VKSFQTDPFLFFGIQSAGLGSSSKRHKLESPHRPTPSFLPYHPLHNERRKDKMGEALQVQAEDDADRKTEDDSKKEEKPKAQPTAEMNARMSAVLTTKGNEVCADCPAKRPLWVSFLSGRVENDRKLGVLICTECAQHHHFELGKRCFIKYLKMVHECEFMIVECQRSVNVDYNYP